MRKSLETKLLYDFEDNDKKNKWLDSDQPIAVLRRFINKMHAAVGKARKPPTVIAGRGTWYKGRWLSYSEGSSKVELVRNQRTRRTAIHEFAHIQGPINHGDYFIEVYVDLLVRFGKYKRKILYNRLSELGILRR